MNLNLERFFIVEDLKQYVYCPRIVYYPHCMPGIRPQTYSMEVGREEHLAARANARRRTFSQMGFEEGERAFDVEIVAPELNLHGKIDEVVTTLTGEMIPVDYKGARKVAPNHRVQLAAYALLLESAYSVTVTRAYVYLIPLRKTHVVPISLEDKQHIRDLLSKMAEMTQREVMPDPTPERQRCTGCEFRRFCNDV